MTDRDVQRALILSGGGARGAYQAGVWRYLQERGWVPDLVVGTSVGSLNAALIGMGWDFAQLSDFWSKIERNKVYRSAGWWRFFRSVWPFQRQQSPGALLDPSPLKSLLEEVVDFEGLRASEIEVIVTAVHVATARLRYFDSSQIKVEHLMASCSLPVIFPWQMIDGTPYWDGGIMANTPIVPALRRGATEIVAVLLAPLSGVTSPLPRTRLQALEWAVEIATLGSAVTAVEPFIDSLDLPEQNREDVASTSRSYPLGERRLVVAAPQESLGVRSVLGISPARTNDLIAMGYRDARAQLGGLIP